MIRIDCDAARENIDAYAIGALDADEAPALEAHLASCTECAHLADDAREGAGALALSVPLVPASSALKARVMASAAVLTPPLAPRRLRPSARWWPLAAAALFVVSAGALTWGAMMQRQASDLRGQRAAARADATRTAAQLASTQQQQQALASWQDGMLLISSQADVERSDLNGTALAPSARGTYVWSAKEAMGALLATNLPPLPDGRIYRFWFVYDSGKWDDAGVAALDASGHAQLIVRRSDSGGTNEGKLRGFALTVEPAGGGQRAGAMVLQSDWVN